MPYSIIKSNTLANSFLCRLCNAQTIFKFSKKNANSIEASYYECTNCLSLQTCQSDWFNNSFTQQTEEFKTDKAFRCISNFTVLPHIYNALGTAKNATYMNWGRDSGLLARLMRDIGFNYISIDKQCSRIFADGFQKKPEINSVDVISLFDIIEYYKNPESDWDQIFSYNPSTIIFTAQLYNGTDEICQNSIFHNENTIFLHSARALSMLAERKKYFGYQVGEYFIFQRTEISNENIAQLNSILLNTSNLQLNTYNEWRDASNKFIEMDRKLIQEKTLKDSRKKIIIDGVFFQLNNSGIARVWESLFKELAKSPIAKNIIILNRRDTAPLIPGLEYLDIPEYDYNNTEYDEIILGKICLDNNASLFISTYYSTQQEIKSLLMIHDLIPEILGWDMTLPMWAGKIKAIKGASNYLCVSHNTASDLKRYYKTSPQDVSVAHCGVSSSLKKSSTEELINFKEKYNITKKYFLIVGERGSYKNIELFFKGIIQLVDLDDYEVICLGGQLLIESEFSGYVSKVKTTRIRIDDNEMSAAYSGAIALVYPSLYEGFGMPIAEAMACECPVITCPNGSIPEVSAEAAIYVDSNDPKQMHAALVAVQQTQIRKTLIAKGLYNCERFSWEKMARVVIDSILRLERADDEFSYFLNTDERLYEKTIHIINEINKDKFSVIALLNLKKVRLTCAQYIIDTPNHLLNIRLNHRLKEIHSLLIKYGVFDLPKDWDEQKLLDHIDQEEFSYAKACTKETLIKMLFNRPHFILGKLDISDFDQNHLDAYLEYAFHPPSNFLIPGEADLYLDYFTNIIKKIHNELIKKNVTQKWLEIAIKFINTSSIIPLYFASSNLTEVMMLRGEIIEFFMSSLNNQTKLDFEFGPKINKKIKVGILAAHFLPQTETYATLPVYQNLDSEIYEVILISQAPIGSHPLELSCKKYASSSIILTGDIANDVAIIRDLDLDFIWIGTNLTAVLNYMVQLSAHRLARVQVTGGCSPVTTGLKNIDIFCSGNLTESVNAFEDYSEKLYLIDGPAHCFEMSESLNAAHTSCMLDKEELGIPSGSTTFISGANFFKLIPELLDSWISILKSVSDSYLILFPFNPNWTNSYPAANLIIQIEKLLIANGLETNRIILIKPMENRHEILDLIKSCDIYLDSFPYSGMTSLLDPLEVKIPIVALEGKHQRERMSASALKSLHLDKWLTSNVDHYVIRAIELAESKNLQHEMKNDLIISMSGPVKFLDPKWFTLSVENLINNSTN